MLKCEFFLPQRVILKALLVFLVITIGIGASNHSHAEDPPLSIDASTSKNFYNYGESVGVNGKIKNYDSDTHEGMALVFQVFSPQGEIVALGQADPGQFGAFSFNFVARGDLFLSSGNYSIEMTFGEITTEIPMFFSGGEEEIEDSTPPIILQPVDIEVFAESSDSVLAVTYDVFATDNFDENIVPTCKPESGFLFGIGETIVKCTAKDSSGNFAIPVTFSVKVNPPVTSIPIWIKDVAGFWCLDQIDDASFVQGIQYLVDTGIIVVPATSEDESDSQEVPQWVKNNACWWSDGSITDLDFATGIEFLVKKGIILV